jgi:hypothetical protein
VPTLLLLIFISTSINWSYSLAAEGLNKYQTRKWQEFSTYSFELIFPVYKEAAEIQGLSNWGFQL